MVDLSNIWHQETIKERNAHLENAKIKREMKQSDKKKANNRPKVIKRH